MQDLKKGTNNFSETEQFLKSK